jgi:nitrogen fixation NifU-like protein
LGPLPPLKIHCAQLVEEALRSALAPGTVPERSKDLAPTLLQQFQSTPKGSKKIVLG